MFPFQSDYILEKERELQMATSDIEEIRAKAARETAEKAQHQVTYDHLIQALDFQVLEARNRLDQLREAGEDSWEDMKQTMESAATELRTAIKDLVSRLG